MLSVNPNEIMMKFVPFQAYLIDFQFNFALSIVEGKKRKQGLDSLFGDVIDSRLQLMKTPPADGF